MAACSVTPWRSLKLVPCEKLPEISSSALLTPVRKSRSVGCDSFSLAKLEDHITSLELSFTSFSVELVKVNVEGNVIKPFLTITRKLKTYDEH